MDVSQHTTTEAAILSAATDVFIEKGFIGARTTEIARRAGVTHAMLHYYFRTKEGLFERVITQKIGDMHRLVTGCIASDRLPLFERVGRGVVTHFDFLAENPGLAAFIIGEFRRDPALMNRLVQIDRHAAATAVADLQSEIDAQARLGLCRQVDALMLLTDILSLNLCAFTSLPLMEQLFPAIADDPTDYLARRRRENLQTILNRLRP